MPRPLTDDTDPNLKKINEVLVDYVTRHLQDVPRRRLMISDGISCVLDAATFPLAFFLSIHIYAIFLLVVFVINSKLQWWINPVEFLIAGLLTILSVEKVRAKSFVFLFHLMNLGTFGTLIKTIARGYQLSEPLSHRLLSPNGLLFSTIGTYAESMERQHRATYHDFQLQYQFSRTNGDERFNNFVKHYWKDRHSS